MSPPKKKAQGPPLPDPPLPDPGRSMVPCVEWTPRQAPGSGVDSWQWTIVCKVCAGEYVTVHTSTSIHDHGSAMAFFRAAHVECNEKWEAAKDK